jgi:hypothetical protein
LKYLTPETPLVFQVLLILIERSRGASIWATTRPIRRHLRPIEHPLVQIAKANSIELENVVPSKASFVFRWVFDVATLAVGGK